jgi:hypothetical protein
MKAAYGGFARQARILQALEQKRLSLRAAVP